MEDHSEHWKSTLMGWDFWKDAQDYQDQLEMRWSQPNESAEKGPRAQEEGRKQERLRQFRSINPPSQTETSSSNIAPRHSRKFSMTDTKGVPSVHRNRSVTTTVTSRIRGGLGLIRHARSPSPGLAEPWRPQTPGARILDEDLGVSHSWREMSTNIANEKRRSGLSPSSWTPDQTIRQPNLGSRLEKPSSPDMTNVKFPSAPLSPSLNMSPMPSPPKRRPRPLGRDLTAADSLKALKEALAEEQWGREPDNGGFIQNTSHLKRDKRGRYPGDPKWTIKQSTSQLDFLASMLGDAPSPELPASLGTTDPSIPGWYSGALGSPAPSQSPNLRPSYPEQLGRVRESEIATLGNPLIGFRGGDSWSNLPRIKRALGLDLFWPWPPDSRDSGYDCLGLAELKPLCDFRSLRSLKIVGMMQSYQSYIWQAAWLNLDLDELELGMALEPDVVNRIYETRWRVIDEGWTLDPRMGGSPVYFGNRGDGELPADIGCGEYLDKQSIEKAKIRAMAMGRTSRRLSIRKITLSGFVVDADPFIQWFDPEKLRCIHFKGRCIDAGFWLPLSMKKVSVRFPRKIDYQPVPVGILNIDVKKDLKVVELEGGKTVNETSYMEFVSDVQQVD